MGFVAISPSSTYQSTERNLASIPGGTAYDFSTLQGGSLKVAASRSVLERSLLNDISNELTIGVASFNLDRGGIGSSDACNYYSEVLVTFEAIGVAVSGDKPEIELELPCLPGKREGYLKKYSIAKAQIVSIEVESSNETRVFEDDLTMKVRNLDDFWPKNWRLKQISWIPQEEAEEPLVMTSSYSPALSNKDFLFQLYK